MPRWFGRVDARRFGEWWALSFCIVALTVLAYLAYIKHIGAVDEFLNQEAKREKGNDQPLRQVLDGRRYWIDVSFTPLAIGIGKIAAPILLFRLILLRRPIEIFPLAILIMATIEYVHFKNGADVHTFWPLPYAPYWALSVGVLARTAIDLAELAVARLDDVPAGLTKDVIQLGVLGAIGLLPLLVLPDGVRGLYYARTTGGRFSDRGRRIFQDVDKSEAAEWLGSRMSVASRVQIHASMHTTWAVDWAMRRPTTPVDGPPSRSTNGQDRYFLADLAFMKPLEQAKMAHDFHVVAVGQFVLVDRAAPPRRPMASCSTRASRVPSSGTWSAGTDPIRTVRPDPWYTWELRDEFGADPEPAAAVRPPAGDARRSAHRSQRRRRGGRSARARTRFRPSSWRGSTRKPPRSTPTVRSCSASATRRASRRRSTSSSRQPARRRQTTLQFDIQAVVERAPLRRLSRPTERSKAAGMPFVIPPRLWKSGFIYVDHTEIRHRPGRERFFGFFIGGPDATGRSPSTARATSRSSRYAEPLAEHACIAPPLCRLPRATPALLVLAAGCGSPDARVGTKFASDFVPARHAVSVLGVFKDGQMSADAWETMGPKLSPSLGASECDTRVLG